MREPLFRFQKPAFAILAWALLATLGCGRSFSLAPAVKPEQTPGPKATHVTLKPFPAPSGTPVSLPTGQLSPTAPSAPAAETTQPTPPTTSPELAGSSQESGESSGTKNTVQSLRIVLEQKMMVYGEKKGILEPMGTIPAKSIVELQPGYHIQNLPHRDHITQRLKYSTTGFISPVRLVSVADITEARINELNQTEGGLFLAASVLQDIENEGEEFASLSMTEPPSEEYLSLFESNGKPKFSYPTGLKKRFGEKVNVRVLNQTEADKVKYTKIMNELVRAVSRETPSPRSLMMMDRTLANFHSKEFERSGLIATHGAWSIAVSATAVRRGFANTPCAEFASEVIRQAYQRAGYDVTDDFSKEKKNQLIWHRTASVKGLSNALFKAGWVVWRTHEYRPPAGAIMLKGTGTSPGHVFFAAGADGRWIVDNGSPREGRNLYTTKLRTLENLYKAGAFILPPGITPKAWDQNHD